MHAISRCDSVNSFSHTGNITFQTLKNKQNKLDKLTHMVNFGEYPSLSLESSSVVTSIQYVCYLHDDNKSDSSVDELQCRMFTKKNSSRDHLAPTLDVLVLHLCRALIFFHRYLFNFFSELFFSIYQKYKI